MKAFWLGVLLVSPAMTGCSGCSKEDAAKPAPSATPALAAPGASSAPSPAATPAPSGTGAAAPAPAYAAPKAAAGDAAVAAAAVPSTSAAAAAAPTPDAGAPAAATANEDIPKACEDAFGRLGRLTFASLPGGKVKITGAKGSSATCTRNEPTKYTCDWIVDGKPTGSFPARLDAAKKSVNGSIDKGKMWNCSKMER